VVTPENFAQSVVDDYGLPSSYHSVITKSIQDQLSDFKAHSANYDGEGGDLPTETTIEKGSLDEDDVTWWNSWRRRLRTPSGHVRIGKAAGGKARKRRKVDKAALSDIPVEMEGKKERPLGVEEIEVDEKAMHEEMRILIKVRRFSILWAGCGCMGP
jgi:SWI/SNF-related matrix-associated actin-dependent regulator of chromatin subfamily B protein 1